LLWTGTTLTASSIRSQNILIANDIIQNALSTANLQLQSNGGPVTIIGDLNVQGTSTGTAPRVTGVMYVTMDGDDNNDGLSEDRAKQTIASAAGKAADMIRNYGWVYATIFVRAGTYVEPNPIIVHSGITVYGDNLRSVTVIPANPTKDIFWANPKTYFYGMTFRGLQHPGAVIQFPENGTSVISDLHDWASPYIQNCSSINVFDYANGGAEAGTGMIVDGARGRKLALPDTGNVTIEAWDNIISDSVAVILTASAPNIGNVTVTNPPWTLESGIAGVRASVIDIGSTTYLGQPAYHITFDTPVNNSVIIPTGWDGVLSNESVVVYESSYPDLGNAISSDWVIATPEVLNARTLLIANRRFLQEEVVAFVNTTYPNFVYSQYYCYRDVGTIVDCVTHDLVNGGYDRSYAAGLAYFNANGVTIINGQLVETTAALAYAKKLALNIITNTVVGSTFQNLYTQVTDPSKTGGTVVYDKVNTCYDIVINLIRNGPTGSAQGIANAATLLLENIPFMQAEAIAYITYNYPSLQYSQQLCARDVGLIVHGMVADLQQNVYDNSVKSAQAYWKGVTSNLPSDEVGPTVAVLNYLLILASQIVSNISITSHYQHSVDQIIDNVNYPGGSVTTTKLTTMFKLIADTIANGLDHASAITNAANLLRINRAFVQAEAVAYINTTYPGFVYDQALCYRDSGFILDAAIADLLLGGNEASINAGLSYWGYSTIIPGEIPQTVSAVNYIKTLADSIILNNLAAPTYQTQVTQTIDLTKVGGTVAATAVNTSLNTIASIIQNGPGVTPLIYGNGGTTRGPFNARDLLLKNKQFLQAEIVAYVNATYPNFSYDQKLCYRDVGLIIDNIVIDIANGGNSYSIICGQSYFIGTSSILQGQVTETVAAIQYLKSCCLSVIGNNLVPFPRQTSVLQALDNNLQGGFIVKDQVISLFDNIINIIQTGPTAGPTVYGNYGSSILTSIAKINYNGQTAWRLNFDGDNVRAYQGRPITMVNYQGPMVLVTGSSIRPYTGQGLNSMVLDAFTQYNETKNAPLSKMNPLADALTRGGNGIVIKNGGYAQLVSIFEICCNIGVLCQSGGTCSITNSNTDFGNYGLLADGVSELQYSCNIYGGNQPNGVYVIANLPRDAHGKFKRPYVGQVATIGQLYYTLQGIRIDPANAGSGYDPHNPPPIYIDSPTGPGAIPAQARAVVAPDGTISSVDVLVSGQQFTGAPAVVIGEPPGAGNVAIATAVVYPTYYTILSATEPNSSGQCQITIDESVPYVPLNGDVVDFYQVSRIIASSHSLEYVGSGTDIATCIPARGGVPIQSQEVVETAGGRVNFTSTDHLGNFRIGQGIVINQNSGTISGRVFQKSLYALMTPLILSIQG
jgi:hypothetical protein